MANTTLLAVGAVNANLNTYTGSIWVSEAIKRNLYVFNGALVVCLIMGPLSYGLFWFQRRKELPELTHIDKNELFEEKKLFEQVLEDIKLGKRPNVNFIVRLADVVFLIFDYPLTLHSVWVYITEYGYGYIAEYGDPIWGALILLSAFLPGFAWHSYNDLVGAQNRFFWFLASLFFPGFVAWTRVSMSFNKESDFLFFSATLLIGVANPFEQ